MNSSDENIKIHQLKKHKAVATGLFLLMTAVYIVSTWLLKTKDTIWLGYIKAFSEAAMVGALADWFAVTALFHHPLGIPIPHTNLIENRKKNIGDNLGGFIVTNFLNPPTIRPYLEKIDLSSGIIKWLGKDKNSKLFVDEVSKLIRKIITTTNEKTIVQFINNQSKTLLKEIKLNEVIASGLDIVMDRDDHIRTFDFLTEKLREYVLNNEVLIRERVKKESHFLIPGFVDNLIASKITNGLSRYLNEIENDPEHKIRKDINQQLVNLIKDIRTNPKWQLEFQNIKESIINGNQIEQYANSIWKHLQKSILTDLEDNNSSIKSYFGKSIDEMIQNLQNDEAMQIKLNKWIQYNAYKYILRNTEKVGELISSTVGNWEGKELSNKLELEVGKDLQFIRINGTLVGGLVGLLIYTITHFIQNS